MTATDEQLLARVGAMFDAADPMPPSVAEDAIAAFRPAAAALILPSGRGHQAEEDARREGTTSRMTEAQLLQAVRDLARLTGWETYHTHNSRRSGPGWPDLVLANAKQGRALFVELKTAAGRVSVHQEKWLGLLAACGKETAVWRPADLPEIARILRGKRIGGGS